VAAGSIERPIVFPGNDRPGVMMASAVRTYVNRFAALPGRQVALFTNNDDGWRTVEAIRRAGGEVSAVVDSRGQVPVEYQSVVKASGLRVLSGCVSDVKGGVDGVRGVVVTGADGRRQEVAADCLAVSGGWNPNVGLS